MPRIPGLRTGLSGLAGLAAFIRGRLGEVGDSLVPLLTSRRLDEPVPAAVREASMAVVGAAAPFAATSYARARLLRQMHASGLLTERGTEQAEALFGVAQ